MSQNSTIHPTVSGIVHLFMFALFLIFDLRFKYSTVQFIKNIKNLKWQGLENRNFLIEAIELGEGKAKNYCQILQQIYRNRIIIKVENPSSWAKNELAGVKITRIGHQ